jgi:hypothetical protein
MGSITMAIKELYSDYQSVDYNAQYDLVGHQQVIAPHLIDHKRLELDPDDSLPMWQMRNDLKHVASLTFRYQAHTTSNDNARDTLRYGICETLSGNHQMWGFETYQEFRDHLAVRDKINARDVWDETTYELRNSNCKFLFWVPKSDQHVTLPGCWAMTITQDAKRSALVWVNNDIRLFDNLKLSKQNKVIIGQDS